MSTALVLFSLTTGPAAAYPGPSSAVFDPSRVDWRFVNGHSYTEFTADIAQYMSMGFMIVDFELDDQLWSGIFQRNTDGRQWRIGRVMAPREFATQRTLAAYDNLRLIDLEVYPVTVAGGVSELRYSALWVENREGVSSVFRAGMNGEEMAAYFDQQRSLGRMPIDVERHWLGPNTGCYIGCYGYLAIWVDNPERLDWRFSWNLSDAQYAEKFADYKDAFRPTVVQAEVVVAGVGERHLRYAGIWVENRNGRGWAEVRNMDDAVFARRQGEFVRDYRPVAYESHYQDQRRHAMIWRRND